MRRIWADCVSGYGKVFKMKVLLDKNIIYFCQKICCFKLKVMVEKEVDKVYTEKQKCYKLFCKIWGLEDPVNRNVFNEIFYTVAMSPPIEDGDKEIETFMDRFERKTRIWVKTRHEYLNRHKNDLNKE